MVVRLSGKLRMDRIPRSPRTLVPGAARSEREYKASHGKTARARVVVQVAAPSCCCGPFLEARRIGPWGLFGGGSAPFACACLAPHSSIASRAPPPPAPTLSRLRSWRRWGDKRRRDMKRAQARLICQYCLTRACHWRGVLWRSEQAEGCRHRHHGLRLFICARLRIC
jgi:hypothetical protein